MGEIDKLRTEAEQVAEKIKRLQAQIDSLDDPKDAKHLAVQKKDLQYQALFYLEKIHNLKQERI